MITNKYYMNALYFLEISALQKGQCIRRLLHVGHVMCPQGVNKILGEFCKQILHLAGSFATGNGSTPSKGRAGPSSVASSCISCSLVKKQVQSRGTSSSLAAPREQRRTPSTTRTTVMIDAHTKYSFCTARQRCCPVQLLCTGPEYL